MQRESMTIVTLWRDGLARPCHSEKEIEDALADGFAPYNPKDHEYPRWMYSGTLSAKVDNAAREQELTREGWTRTPSESFVPDSGGVEISHSVLQAGGALTPGTNQGGSIIGGDVRDILVEVLLTNSKLATRLSRLEESLGVGQTAAVEQIRPEDRRAGDARAQFDARDREEAGLQQTRQKQEEEKSHTQAVDLATKQRLTEDKQHVAEKKVLANKDGKETKEPPVRDLPKTDPGKDGGPKETI